MVQDSTVKDGEERVAAVYRDHHKRMWRALFSFAGDPDHASPAMAEAFARALRDQHTIRDLTAWTWSVAFRICADRRTEGRMMTGNASRLAVFALVVGCALTACSIDSAGTPGPSSGPAFGYVAWKQTACGQDTCVSLRVRNDGNEAGPGTCALTDDAGGSNPGSRAQLPIVEPGKFVDVTLRWSGRAPKGTLSALCEPGLRS
jgi:hypothetical protein